MYMIDDELQEEENDELSNEAESVETDEGEPCEEE